MDCGIDEANVDETKTTLAFLFTAKNYVANLKDRNCGQIKIWPQKTEPCIYFILFHVEQ